MSTSERHAQGHKLPKMSDLRTFPAGAGIRATPLGSPRPTPTSCSCSGEPVGALLRLSQVRHSMSHRAHPVPPSLAVAGDGVTTSCCTASVVTRPCALRRLCSQIVRGSAISRLHYFSGARPFTLCYRSQRSAAGWHRPRRCEPCPRLSPMAVAPIGVVAHGTGWQGSCFGTCPRLRCAAVWVRAGRRDARRRRLTVGACG